MNNFIKQLNLTLLVFASLIVFSLSSNGQSKGYFGIKGGISSNLLAVDPDDDSAIVDAIPMLGIEYYFHKRMSINASIGVNLKSKENDFGYNRKANWVFDTHVRYYLLRGRLKYYAIGGLALIDETGKGTVATPTLGLGMHIRGKKRFGYFADMPISITNPDLSYSNLGLIYYLNAK